MVRFSQNYACLCSRLVSSKLTFLYRLNWYYETSPRLSIYNYLMYRNESKEWKKEKKGEENTIRYQWTSSPLSSALVKIYYTFCWMNDNKCYSNEKSIHSSRNKSNHGIVALSAQKSLAISIAILTISKRNTINSDFIYIFPFPPKIKIEMKKEKRKTWELCALPLLLK